MKICNKCKKEKTIDQFFKDSQRIDGRSYSCKECSRSKYASRGKEYRKRNPNQRKNSQLKYEFGITLDEYNQMAEAQKGLCAICNQESVKRNLDVDHDHSTGKIRGLLCGNCNKGIGLFKDSQDLLNKAVNYIRRSNEDS